MSRSKIKLPSYIRTPSESVEAPYDSCFVVSGFLFPESREDLKPNREFPLSEPFYARTKTATNAPSSPYEDLLSFNSEDSESNDFDSTILQISETDELLLDVQGMGIQYCLHTQICLRRDWTYEFPHTWDKNQVLLMNIPVFSEELCQWHYPFSAAGYNSASVDPPLDLDIAHNYPQLFGYLPNGDIAIYWEIAEALAELMPLTLEPLKSTIDGSLILMPGMSQLIKSQAPTQSFTETGIVVGPRDSNLGEAISYATRWLKRRPVVIRDAPYHFYCLRLPIIQCELDFNSYSDATWGAFGYSTPRLLGYEFKVMNNPFTRQVPIFATENGNIIVSYEFYDRLKALLEAYGMPLGTMTMPIQRIS